MIVNESCIAAGCEINIQKYFSFLCTKDVKSEREIKEKIPLTIAAKSKILRNKCM